MGFKVTSYVAIILPPPSFLGLKVSGGKILNLKLVCVEANEAQFIILEVSGKGTVYKYTDSKHHIYVCVDGNSI